MTYPTLSFSHTVAPTRLFLLTSSSHFNNPKLGKGVV